MAIGSPTTSRPKCALHWLRFTRSLPKFGSITLGVALWRSPATGCRILRGPHPPYLARRATPATASRCRSWRAGCWPRRSGAPPPGSTCWLVFQPCDSPVEPPHAPPCWHWPCAGIPCATGWGFNMLTTATCLCGNTRVEANQDALKWCGHCHCHSCRKAAGAPLVTWAGYATNACRWAGADASTYESTPGTIWSRCANCGSLLSYQSTRWPDELHLAAALLDTVPTPQFHTNWSERPGWIDYADRLPRHAHMSDAGDAP